MDFHRQSPQQQQLVVKAKKSKKSSENTRMTKKSFKAMKVVYISTPMKVTTSASKFRAIVQELTGRESDVVSIMETSAGNDSWMVNEDHVDSSGCKEAAEVTTMNNNYANDERSPSSVVPAVVDGSSPSVSSSEEFDNGVFVKGQHSNFGVFDHTSFLFDQFFHQFDVLGGY